MVTPAMRRYRRRSDDHASLVIPPGQGRLDLAESFAHPGPYRLEIGCGHGEFISQMAAAHPAEGFIGLELDRLRVTKCAHKCLREGARNVRMLDGDAAAAVTRLPDAAFHRVYILFPDPWPKVAHRRRRLVNRAFLEEIARVTAPGGRLIFASDVHDYAMQVLSQTTTLPGQWRNLLPGGYAVDLPVRFPTVFERHRRAEGATVCHLRFERRS
jgi:tRNA (guanine-N7-)-methyltransferase